MSIDNPHENNLYDVEIEKALLSALLMPNTENHFVKVSQILNAEDFYRPEHRLIFADMCNSFKKNHCVNIVFLIQEMKTSGVLDKVGATYAFFLVAEPIAPPIYSERYAQIVKEKSTARRVHDIAFKISADARAGLKTTANIIAEATDAFIKILSAADTKITSGADYFEKFFSAEIEENKKFSERQTGFSNIDEKQIFSAGLYVLGAISANGKTTFAWQLLNQLAARGETCLYCSYEMSRLELFSKSVAVELYLRDQFTTITSADIRRGAWTPKMNGIVQDLKTTLANIQVIELADETVDDLLKILTTFVKLQLNRPLLLLITFKLSRVPKTI